MVDADVEHRTVTAVDYAPFDDVVEIQLSTPTGDLRILIDQPDELLASDDSDPYFAIAIVSNGSTIVVRDATAPERGHEGNAGVTDTAARSLGLGGRGDTLRA